MIPVPAPSSNPRWRLAWFGAIAFVVIFGVVDFGFWVISSATGESWWAEDLLMVLRSGHRLLDGAPLYADPKFLYPPAAAIAAAAVAWADPLALSLVFAVGKILLVMWPSLALTRHWSPAPRVMVVLGIICSLPFLHDLMLGNVNAFIAVAALFALFEVDRPRSGVVLGVVAAVFAKPLIVPILLLLLVRRRSTFTGAAVALASVSLASVIVAGPGAYVAWAEALRQGARYAAPFAGNHGITAIAPDLWLPTALLVACGLIAVVVRGRWVTAVTWAVTSGILLAPYAGTYAALPVVVALPLLGPGAPLIALGMVGLSPVATTYLLPLYAAVILVATLRAQDPGQALTRLAARP